MGIATRGGFISERVPQLVANRYDRFVSAVAVVAADGWETAFISPFGMSAEKRPRDGEQPVLVPLLAAHHDPDANRLESLELHKEDVWVGRIHQVRVPPRRGA